MKEGDVLDDGIVGTCPVCHNAIDESNVVITYERRSQRTIFARCGECRKVVEPR